MFFRVYLCYLGMGIWPLFKAAAIAANTVEATTPKKMMKNTPDSVPMIPVAIPATANPLLLGSIFPLAIAFNSMAAKMMATIPKIRPKPGIIPGRGMGMRRGKLHIPTTIEAMDLPLIPAFSTIFNHLPGNRQSTKTRNHSIKTPFASLKNSILNFGDLASVE